MSQTRLTNVSISETSSFEDRSSLSVSLSNSAEFSSAEAAEKGILNNWDIEKVVWDRVFGSKGRGLAIKDFKETRIAVTEPVMNLPNVQEHYDQMLFEEYEFDAVLRCPAPCFVPFSLGSELAVVVDAGFSFTHVVPIWNGRILSQGVRRVDVGGKMLTNYMKELVSYRHLYMMDQTSCVEHMKHVSCYVAGTYALETRRTDTVRTFVLPDFVPTSKNKLGYLLPPGQSKPAPKSNDDKEAQKDEEEEELLQLDRERYQVPELLFNPGSIGIKQMGLPEALADSINSLPFEFQGLAWSNVLCVGGSTLLPGFEQRLANEARKFANADFPVNVMTATDPVSAAVSSFQLAQSAFKDDWITRKEYLESGSKRRANRMYLSNKDL